MSDTIRKARAETWKRFAEEPGGLFELLDGLETIAINEWRDTKAEDIEARENFYYKVGALKDLRATVRNVINSGTVDAANLAKEAAIASGQMKALHS